MSTNKIPAVFKEDLTRLLAKLGELEYIKTGERTCLICLKTITLDNIQLIIPRSNETFDYVCDSPVCMEEYNRKTLRRDE